MKDPENIKWNTFNSFYQIDQEYEKLRDKQGVYLWVHKGIRKRVVYVGTGTGEDGLFRRLCIEKSEMLSGEAFCFKSDTNIDAYEEYLKKDKGLIKKSVKESKFYFPDSNIKNDFTTSDFIKYLKSISIYTADLTEIKNKFHLNIDEIAKILETQIQVYLLGLENIAYYRKWGFQSWLGRVERLRKSDFNDDFQKLLNYNFKFSIKEIEELNEFITEKSLSSIKEKLKTR